MFAFRGHKNFEGGDFIFLTSYLVNFDIIMLIYFLILNLVNSMADWGYSEINDTVILTPGNHDQFLWDYEEAMVYYYLPKCKYCIVINKFYDEMALEWKEKD